MRAADLRQSDFQSAAWQKLRALYEARLADLREKNDHEMSAEATAGLRGQIRECKHFLALEDPAPENRAGSVFETLPRG